MKILLFLFLLFTSSLADVFDEPSCLEPNINFWESVYSTYGREQIIFHDKNTMKVYLVKNIPLSLTKHKRYREIKHTLDSLKHANPEVEFRAQQGIKELFQSGIDRSDQYIPFIKETFEDDSIPTELCFLPHVESSFNPKAKSVGAGAEGMWQILKHTSRCYGLKKSKYLWNPYVSTYIAADILKDNYNQTKSWPLAILAYNHGLESVKHAMVLLNTDDICTIIENYKGKHFKYASKNYYAQFLAVQRIVGLGVPDSLKIYKVVIDSNRLNITPYKLIEGNLNFIEYNLGDSSDVPSITY